MPQTKIEAGGLTVKWDGQKDSFGLSTDSYGKTNIVCR